MGQLGLDLIPNIPGETSSPEEPSLEDVSIDEVPAEDPTNNPPLSLFEPSKESQSFFSPAPHAEEATPYLQSAPPETDVEGVTALKVEEAAKHRVLADTSRDIYTHDTLKAEFGGSPALYAPDKSDPNYMAFAEFQKDWETAAKIQASGSPDSAFKNVANFLFSDEMGLLGMKWDEEGFSWAWDNFRDQLVEHPISTAVTIGSYMVPIGAAWMKGSRLAKHGLNLATESGEAAAAAGKGILGSNLGYRFDDHSRLVKSLAGSAGVADGRKLFSDDMAAAILNGTPDEIRKLIPEKDLRQMLIGDYHKARYLELSAMAKSGALDAMEGPKGVAARAAWSFRRNFTNTYFRANQNMGTDHIKNIDEFYKSQNYAALLSAMPTQLGKNNSDLAYKYMMGEEGADALKKAVGEDNFNAIDSLTGRWRDLWKDQVDEGFLDEATQELFEVGGGKLETGFHLPAIKTGTPGFTDVGVAAQSLKASKIGTDLRLIRQNEFDPAKALTGPTTKQRGKMTTRESVLEALPGLETDPSKLAVGGFVKDATVFQLHRGFRDMITTSLRGDQRAAHWIRSADEYEAMGSIAKKNFISIDEMNEVVPGLGSRMRRMLHKDLDATGQRDLLNKGMPVIDRDLVENFFGKGPGSGAWSANMAGIFAEMLTGVHKTAATALNPPTHMANVIGNFVFLAQAGMNPLAKDALGDMSVFSHAFAKIAKQHTKSPDKPVDALFEFDNLVTAFGKDRYIKDAMGNRIDLADMLSDNVFREGLLETQAFETVEGFNSLKKTLKHLQSTGDKGFTASAARGVGTAIAGVGELPGMKQTLQTMSAAYLAEDLIPKMMYMSHLARKGWGRDAIFQEVGRRLPQYRTVGDLANRARRVVLPWVTFPAEAARITKNNLMDHPVSMMAWLQAPQALQAVASGAGVGVPYSEYDQIMDSLPSWAARPTTVLLNEQQAAPTLGAVSGGTIGAVSGGALAGRPGAMVGGAAGAAIGGMMGDKSPKRQALLEDTSKGMEGWKEFARGWAVDFLPYSSLMPTSIHPHEWEKINPFDPSPAPGLEAYRTAIDLSPVEPFAIAKPMLDLVSGRGGFGQEIKTKSSIDFANKFALGLLGFISPPALQKYAMNLSTPDGVYKMSDIHDAVGQRQTIPKSTVATFGGLLASSLTFMGAKRLPGVNTGTALKAAGAAGAVGAMSGGAVNTRRLMTDLGLMKNPMTQEEGDWTLDFFVNTWLGTGKSWKASPNQTLFNKELRNRRFTPQREVLGREFDDAILTGSEPDAIAAASAVHKNFALEIGNTSEAWIKYVGWLDRRIRRANRLPLLRTYSDAELNRYKNLLLEMGPEKTKFQRQMLSSIITELKMHQVSKVNGIKIDTESPQ